MKSVLEVAGYFLYCGCMVVILPIVLVLYVLLALVLGCQYLNGLMRQAPKLLGRATAAVAHLAGQRLPQRKRWQLGWLMNKASQA